MPAELGLDHVWITAQGCAILLDEPWPGVGRRSQPIPASDMSGQQRFLSFIAASVEWTSLPVHARRVLHNLEDGKFEKMSFLAGTLGSLLDVTRGLRARSIFMFPLYVLVLVFVGYYRGGRVPNGETSLGGIITFTVIVLGAIALTQILGTPFHTTPPFYRSASI